MDYVVPMWSYKMDPPENLRKPIFGHFQVKKNMPSTECLFLAQNGFSKPAGPKVYKTGRHHFMKKMNAAWVQ